MKNLNSINIEKYTIDKNKLMNDENDLIYRDEQNKQNNHSLKNRDYPTIKESFKYTLKNEDQI
jgi:hypothetical protein